jgi:mono/diheme cytochrome c family protein
MGLLAAQAQAESLAEEQGLQFFERRIRPALVTHCYECHSAGSKKAGGKLYLDHAGGLLRGGESGPAIVPGRPGESLFIRAIRKENDDLVMPPDDKPSLPEAVVNDLVEIGRASCRERVSLPV